MSRHIAARPVSGRHNQLAQLFGLTLLVTAVLVPSGLVIRTQLSGAPGQDREPARLMKIHDDQRTAYGPTGSLSPQLRASQSLPEGLEAPGTHDEAASPSPFLAGDGPVLADPTNDAQPYFNGRPIRKAGQMSMRVTAYSPDHRSCGKWADGVTASGYSVWTNGMKLAAADTRLLPFGTIISISGYNGGRPVPVLDRGSKIKGHRLDVLYPTHEIARTWGVQRLTVTLWEYADETTAGLDES